MPWSGSFDDLRLYLRNFTKIGGDPAYDTNGVLTLLLALIDNLRQTPTTAADLPELAETISQDQAVFLSQLAVWSNEPRLSEPRSGGRP